MFTKAPLVITMRKKLYISTIVVLFLILFNAIFILKTDYSESSYETKINELSRTDAQAYILPVWDVSYFPIQDTAIQAPVIKAKAGVVYDVKSGRYLFSKNINEKLPIASLTKILSSIVVAEKLNFKDIITIPKEAVKVDGERQDLYFGERLTVEDLLKMMLIKSSNDAAYALRIYASQNNIDFLKEMNEMAQEIGMLNSYFKDPAGLNDEAFSNAEDIVKLSKKLLTYPSLVLIMSKTALDIKSIDGRLHHMESTNKLIGEIPDIIISKTGYTDDALGCMVLIVQVSGDNDRIISIVLGSSERFNDIKKLVEWTKQAHRWN